MHFITPQAAYVVKHPGAFALRVLRAFRANQGLLLAGAVAYYTLLSLVPLLILALFALSWVVDPAVLLASLLVFGFFPRLLTDKIIPVTKEIVTKATSDELQLPEKPVLIDSPVKRNFIF